MNIAQWIELPNIKQFVKDIESDLVELSNLTLMQNHWQRSSVNKTVTLRKRWSDIRAGVSYVY